MARKKKTPKVNVRVDNKAYYKMIFGRFITWMGILLGALLLLYLSLSLTIMRVVPTANMGFVPVKNPSFHGGLIPEGAIVLISGSDSPDGILGNAKNTFVPLQTSAIVRVEAGPVGKILWTEGGVTTVDGRMVDAVLEDNPEQAYLSGEYIVKCLVGDCDSGTAFIISKSQVIGVPLLDEYRVEVDNHYILDDLQSSDSSDILEDDENSDLIVEDED